MTQRSPFRDLDFVSFGTNQVVDGHTSPNGNIRGYIMFDMLVMSSFGLHIGNHLTASPCISVFKMY